MKKIGLVLCAAVIFYTLAGCAVRHGDFTVLSNKLTRLSDFEIDKAERNKDIIGKDVQHWILFIPTSGPPTLEDALDQALEIGKGDLMTDAVVRTWGWTILLYGQSGWEVKGDVVRTRTYQ
jgi:hypothetical protein